MGTRRVAIENLDQLTEDNREICFEQGKPCIYEDEDQADSIVTEWPNGVIDTKDMKTGTTIRAWPDGSRTKLRSKPQFPHWQQRAARKRCRS